MSILLNAFDAIERAKSAGIKIETKMCEWGGGVSFMAEGYGISTAEELNIFINGYMAGKKS